MTTDLRFQGPDASTDATVSIALFAGPQSNLRDQCIDNSLSARFCPDHADECGGYIVDTVLIEPLRIAISE